MPDGFLIPSLALLAVLVAGSALFSAIETALFSIHPFQLRDLESRNPTLAATLLKWLENPRRTVASLLLADVLVNVPLTLLALLLMREVALVPIWVKAATLFAIVVIACDLGPKAIALRAPFRVAALAAPLVRPILPLIEPASRLLEQVSDWLADRLTPSRWQPARHLSDGELETLVKVSAEEGTLQVAESEMIQEIIKLGDKTAKDVMTPRVEMFAVPDDLPQDELIARLRARRHRRVPVYGDSRDDILGIIDVRALLLDPATPYTESMLPPSFIPETMKALDLLKNFLTHPQGLAIVVDEFGGTEGIVTLSDIVEEIIADAAPEADQALYIENLGEGRVLVAGRARLDDLAELGIHFTSESVDTIGGLIFTHLGTVPPPGTALELDGHRLTVRRTARKSITEVLVQADLAPEEAEP
jgi:putative hemolysin